MKACYITKNEEVIGRASGGARLPLVAASTLVMDFTTGVANFQAFRSLQRISRSADFIWFYFLSFLC